MVNDPTSKNGEQVKSTTVYVTFTGKNRTTPAGIPVDIKGWWEIHGMTYEAAMEVALGLTDGMHMSCQSRADVPWDRLTAGCTYMVIGGLPTQARALAARMN